jgi:hypothetical protein
MRGVSVTLPRNRRKYKGLSICLFLLSFGPTTVTTHIQSHNAVIQTYPCIRLALVTYALSSVLPRDTDNRV